MGLFDIFKKKPLTHEEKVDLAYRCYKPDMVGMVFHGGKRQASNIICSIAKLVGKNLPALDAKGYYDLLSIYSDVLIRRVVTHSTDDSIIASLQVKHGQDIKNKSVAQKVLAYCTINMNNNDFCLDDEESMEALSLFDNILSQNEQIAQSNIDAQTDNLDDPDYGLTPEKPVYVKGIEGSEEYLRNLRTALGEIVSWERQGSLAVENINGMVDIYEIILPSGKPYKTIYLNMYGTQNSVKIPKGFGRKSTVRDTANKQMHDSAPTTASASTKIELKVPAVVLEQYIEEAYQAVANNYRAPGFRAGKVPRTLVEKLYGDALFWDDAIDRCITSEGLKKLKSIGLISNENPIVNLISADRLNGIVAELEYNNCKNT